MVWGLAEEKRVGVHSAWLSGDIHTILMMLGNLRMNIFPDSSVCENQLGAHQ